MIDLDYQRIGPVYLYWSEYSDAAVIGPSRGAGSGDNIYRCDEHPDWQGEGIGSEVEHAAQHGYYMAQSTAG